MSTHRPPLAGLAAAAGADTSLRTVAELIGTSSVELVAPSAVRPFVAARVGGGPAGGGGGGGGG
ncbi:hypothetical protein, partial [Nocardia abscessus]|uniref:hypothetical protein n=1 Tax=Nocardia abscessus TaxID=120957 RepID=UPI002456F80B